MIAMLELRLTISTRDDAFGPIQSSGIFRLPVEFNFCLPFFVRLLQFQILQKLPAHRANSISPAALIIKTYCSVNLHC